MEEKRDFTSVSVITALAMAVTAFLSVFVKNPYIKESLSYASQGIGQDVFNLAIVSPLLIISALLMKKGGKFWESIWMGAMVYTAYSYSIYAFGVHFNYLFLVYCAILGLSFFGLVFYFSGIKTDAENIPQKHSAASVAAMIFLGIIALIFSILWLSDVIPALINGTVPKAVAENNFFTNPVHVLDLTFAVPACVIAVILMLNKKPLGRVFAVVMLSLTAFMLPALAAMTLGMMMLGAGGGLEMVFVFTVFGAAAAVILWFYTKTRR